MLVEVGIFELAYKLQQAAGDGHFEVCKLLLDRGANANWALRQAARNGHFEVCKLFLDYGANIHVDSDWSLQQAAQCGHFEVCKLLLDHGANVHADQVLPQAAQRGHFEVCKLLLDHGADLTILRTKKFNLKKIVYKFATKDQIKHAKKLLVVQKIMSV